MRRLPDNFVFQINVEPYFIPIASLHEFCFSLSWIIFLPTATKILFWPKKKKKIFFDELIIGFQKRISLFFPVDYMRSTSPQGHVCSHMRVLWTSKAFNYPRKKKEKKSRQFVIAAHSTICAKKIWKDFLAYLSKKCLLSISEKIKIGKNNLCFSGTLRGKW